MKKLRFSFRMICISCALVSSLFFIKCSTPGYNVHHLSEHDTIPYTLNGVYYSLPRSVITVDVLIDETEYHKGPYAEFAEKYLGIKKCNKNNSLTYDIKNIVINSYAEKDPSQVFFIEFDKNFLNENDSFFLSLSQAGLIHSINKPNENQYSETLITEREAAIKKTLATLKYEYAADDNLIERIDTIIKTVEITDSITIERKFLKKTMVAKTIEQKAKEAADFLIKIKEERFNSIIGYAEVNYEKGTIEYMDNKLDELEDKYLKLFTGYSSTKVLKFRFTYTPDKNDRLGLAPLFKFSSKEGILPSSSKKGDYVYIKLNKSKDTDLVSKSLENKIHIEEEKHGFYYRIPEYADITIRQGNIKKAESRLLINQFGVVASLPVNNNTKIQFYPKSGAIKNISFKK